MGQISNVVGSGLGIAEVVLVAEVVEEALVVGADQ